jgi:hypothetical protein
MKPMLAILALFALALSGCSAPGARPELGIEVLGIQLLAGGDLARLDFRVVDCERAKGTLAGEIAVLTADGGTRLEVLSAGRLGPLRQRPSRSGKKQFVMFTNAGRALEPGVSAVVVLGQARVERVPVS